MIRYIGNPELGKAYALHASSRDGFSGGGGGGGGFAQKIVCARTITSAKPEIPYDLGPGPVKDPGSSRGFLIFSRAI